MRLQSEIHKGWHMDKKMKMRTYEDTVNSA